jgi:hypothetical protein
MTYLLTKHLTNHQVIAIFIVRSQTECITKNYDNKYGEFYLTAYLAGLKR